MSEIAIVSSCYHTLENRASKPARERHMQFYRDLYQLYGKPISESTFCEGPGYSYTELGLPVLDVYAKAGELSDLDLVVVVYWSHEFDPDHSSCGPFFAHRYGIKGQIFDVCDQGSVSLFTAFNIIKQYMQHGEVKKVMLLGLEQTSIPRDKADHPVLPGANAAAAMMIRKQDDCLNKYAILVSDIILESSICALPFNAVQFLKYKCKELQIAVNDLTVMLKKSSFFFKNYQYCAVQEVEFCHSLQIQPIESGNGFMPILARLNELSNSTIEARSYVMIIDEDAESLNTGYLIINKKQVDDKKYV